MPGGQNHGGDNDLNDGDSAWGAKSIDDVYTQAVEYSGVGDDSVGGPVEGD